MMKRQMLTGFEKRGELTAPHGRLHERCAMSRTRAWPWLLACTLAAAAPAAYSAACTVSAIGVNFGNYDVFGTLATDITGTVSINCNKSSLYTISLNGGSGTFASRTMTNGANTLTYNLYLDVTRLTIWGDGSPGTGIVSATAKTASHTVYGRIPALQNAPVGNYTDTIIVTMTF